MKKLLLYGFIGFIGLAFVIGGLRACFPKEDVKIEESIIHEQILDPINIEKNTSSFAGALYGNSSNNFIFGFFTTSSSKQKH
ncbi:MAG: hypothetical protein LRY32_06660 [Flavobacterium sp.]|nr:hypothetical protein [Flavobacterium sp.]